MFSRLNLFVASAFVATYVFGGYCNDKRVDCANWAKDGECSGWRRRSTDTPRLCRSRP